MRAKLRAPFPWFGGKSRVAHLVWERFGDVRNYCEPFAGSLAVLLGRPGEPSIETVNDADAHIANFFRAVAGDPEQVARYADWPVNEADLHARHRWLVETGAERVARVKTDPDYFDAKVAGWWVWGLCLWIGSGWCARPEWTGRVHAGAAARGIHRRELSEKLPAIAGRDGGRGAYAKSRGDRASRSRTPEWEQRPDLSSGTGRGVIAEKRPALTGHGGGIGVCRPSLGEAEDLPQKLPALAAGSGGGGTGVHQKSLGAGGWKKRQVLQHGEGGRGVHRQAHQVPDLSGDAGAAGRGIHASGFEGKWSVQIPDMGGTGCGKGRGIIRESQGLQTYMQALADRLRRVRVCCGDFERILGPAVTTCIGLTGVFLDPPYPEDKRSICYAHDGEGVWWRAYRWAIDHGEDPLLRIALCGYEHPEAVFPPGWKEIAWKASGGYGRSARGKSNAKRERIWFSPGCLAPMTLFDQPGVPASPPEALR